MTDHDALYHQLYAHPAMMADLLREFVAGPALGDFDLDGMEPVKTTFYVPGLPKRESDTIWKIPTRSGTDVYLLVLLEFQSESDRWMVLRVIVYMCLLWLQLLHEKKIPAQGPLPPLLPVVLHNGDTPWLTPVNLRELINLPEGSPLWPYQPDGRFFLIDECRFPPEDLQRRDSLSALVFQVEQCRSPEELPALTKAIIAWIEKHPEYAGLRHTLAALLLNALNTLGGERSPPVGDPVNLLEVPTMLQTRMEAWKTSWQESKQKEWLQEGRQEGRQEGEQKGIREGEKRTLLRQIQRRFGPAPEWVQARLDGADLPTLEAWTEKILDADSLPAVFQ